MSFSKMKHPCPAKATRFQSPMALERHPESEKSQAARVIQRAWKKHLDTAVFKYLKKLLSFQNEGDPRLLLRFINPVEANILDSASGALIRFRLGGPTFPPNIYFKIYTRAPVVDMCAFSPRDYTQLKQAIPCQINNSTLLQYNRDDHTGWYKRIENNGWRILSGKIDMFEDPITQETNKTKVDFNHCKIRRQQDVSRKKKILKMKWMRKMYAEGLLHSSPESSKILQKSSGVIEEPEPDAVLEQEVDELLAWITALDFDNYINDWKSLGTSRCCIVFVDELV
ncbi:hypothetical protein DNTS_015360 [Danionella cerebrum]|uniref:Uncharacterized protein n=1 Tax=Danionella cerebrum TaxID=2873325 RepID=A0A553NWU1_9TELE|nr:hypothetical protein DNTS_015360 [Danionella translucida]TRY69900.1 hypothetical protein DNTS_015360 [Danionella translucida]TRY69901.1 hypothetical protein DNTS_015360 [Danionella translucida]TRY69902.1 hypothetical protein DNTS_015360 [Danionella translucida]